MPGDTCLPQAGICRCCGNRLDDPSAVYCTAEAEVDGFVVASCAERMRRLPESLAQISELMERTNARFDWSALYLPEWVDDYEGDPDEETECDG